LGCFKPDIDPYGGTAGQAREGNAITHDLDGQNVLFLDQHVAFEKRSFCGVDRDNIYLVSPSPDKGYVIGWIPIPGGTGTTNARDSVLVHDPPVFSSAASADVQHSTVTQTAAPRHKPHLHDVRAVGDSAVIDDFESFTDDEGSRIYETWEDGWINGSGSQVGAVVGPFAEQSIVHAGRQSLPFKYDNGKSPWYSEAWGSWKTPANLAAYGCDVLTVSVQGRADNGSAKFYIGIMDEAGRFATVAHPDPEVLKATQWVAWRIPLRDFEQGGVDLTHGAKICIGVGDRQKPSRGGTGIVYIDDICLSKSSGAAGAGDVPK